MVRNLYGWSATVAGVCIFVLPFVISAQTLGVGCRLSTAQDKAEMAARGIPQKFEVCPEDEKILGIGRGFEQWYEQLKTQSPCNRNTCTLSCRTRNTGAQVCGPTASRWNSIGCHPNNRIAIFPTVPHGFAAHIELLRRYCGERGRCTIGSVVQQWTGTVGDRPAYAAFVSKNAGIPVNQVFDPNDIDMVGRLAMAMACYEAGSLPYSAAELKQGLVMASGGARVPVPANVGQLLNESLTGSYTASPSGLPGSHPGSWTYPLSSITGSTYMPPQPPASPLPIINQPGSSSGLMNGGGNSTYTSSPFANISPIQIENSSPTQSTNTPSNGTTPYVPRANTDTRYFASSISVQPREAAYGETFVVSWTSVGMNPANPCHVFINSSALFGQGSEGMKIVAIPRAMAMSSTTTYTLKCTTLSGILDEHSASVTLR